MNTFLGIVVGSDAAYREAVKWVAETIAAEIDIAVQCLDVDPDKLLDVLRTMDWSKYPDVDWDNLEV